MSGQQHFTPGKDPVPVIQEAGWAPGPVWTGGKSRLHRGSIKYSRNSPKYLYKIINLIHFYISVTMVSNYVCYELKF